MTTKPNSGTVSVSRELLERMRQRLIDLNQIADFGPELFDLINRRAQPADQQGEPVAVAWMRFDDDQRAIFTRSKRSKSSEPLYAHPTAYRHAQPATAKVDERVEFEAWHNIRYPLHSMLLGFCERTGGYSYPSRREMFEVWQARAKLNGGQS